MNNITLKSYAKLNIGLVYTGKRDDGYHLLESYFQEIDLHDDIILKENTSDVFRLSSDKPSIPVDGRNTIMMALEKIKPYLPPRTGADLHLIKRIPDGAGLGGGSSNAAAVIKYFSDKYKIDKNIALEIATGVGADVPFFLDGGLQFVSGIGDKLKKLDGQSDLYFVLIFPDFSVSTKEAYSLLNFNLTKAKYLPKITGFITQPTNWALFENAFEDVLIPAHPQIRAIKEQLLSLGAVHAGLSGSGSTVYGVCKNEEQASTAIRELSSKYTAILSRPVIR